MGHFLERVERGTVPDKLTQNPRERNVRTMQDIVADNEREGVKMPSVHGEIAGKSGKKTTPQKQQSKNIFALSNNPVKAVKGIENSIALYENLRNKYGQSRIKKNDAKNEKGKADSSNMDLSAWNVWKNGIRQLFSNPWYVNSNENLGVARNLAKSAIDQSIDSSVKREYTSRPGEIIETRWSGKTYGVDRNNNGKLDTFEVESGSNPFNNFYYTLAKPAAVAAKDSLISAGHFINDTTLSIAAGAGDYLYNLGRAGKAVVEQENPFAKVELETPFGDSAPMRYIKNNTNVAAARAEQSADHFGAVGRFMNQIVQSAGQMAPSLAAAYLTGGQSASADLSRAGMTAFEKATQLLKLPKHMIPTFLSQAGQSYNDALEQTGNPTRALEYGIVNGYLNALIEQGGVQESVAAGSLQNSAKQSAWEFVKDNMLEEGVEEITQNVTEGALRKMMVDPSAPLFSTQDENAVINPKRDLYAGAVGAVAGGLFGGANKAINNIANAGSNATNKTQNRFVESVVTTPKTDITAQTNINSQENVSTPPQNPSNMQTESNINDNFSSMQNAAKTEQQAQANKRAGESLTLKKVGNSYETYGKTAQTFAEQLGLKIEDKPVTENGKVVGYIDAVTIPVDMLGNYVKQNGYAVKSHEKNGVSYVTIAENNTGQQAVDMQDSGNVQNIFDMTAPNSNTVQNEKSISTNLDEKTKMQTPNRPVEILDTDTEPVRAAKNVMNILSDRYGVQFETFQGDSKVNGKYDPTTKTIYINENSSDPMLNTVSHEFLHSFKQTDTEGYQLLKNVVESDMNLVKFNEYKKSMLESYDEIGIDYSNLSNDEINDLVLEESMSDLMTEVMRDPATIERIAKENRSLAQKIMDGLTKIINEIKQVINTYFGSGNKEVQELVYNFEKVKEIYQEVLAQSGGTAHVSDGMARYSVKYNGGKPTVVIEDNIFAGHEGEKPHKVIRDYIKNHYTGDFARIIESGQKVYFGKDLPGEYTQSVYTKKLYPDLRYAKNQSAQNLNELIEIGTDRRWDKNVKEKHMNDAKYGWYKYSTRFQIQNENYTADVLIRNDADGKKYLYDIQNIKKERGTSKLPSNQNGLGMKRSVPLSDTNTIAQNQDSVNSSISDSAQNDTEKTTVDLESGERGSVVRRKDKAEESMRRFEESGNMEDLPDRSWAKTYHKDSDRKNILLQNQISTLEFELEHEQNTDKRAALNDMLKKAREKQAEAQENYNVSEKLMQKLNDLQAIQEEQASQWKGNADFSGLEGRGSAPRNFELVEIAGDLHDIGSIKGGNLKFNDIYRNLKRVFSEHYGIIEPMVDGFDGAKGDYARETIEILAEMNQYVKKELGIKKGSKADKAIQWIAEGERRPNVRRRKDREALQKMGITDIKNLDPNITVPYTEQMLVEDFGTDRASEIKKAAEWFRSKYDELIDDINSTQRIIYPNRPDKLIPKRKDYMRHFQELGEGLSGLLNIFNADNNIDPKLVGISENTKPKEKFASIKQRRSGKATKEGAIEGFLDYISQAEYAIHINPYIDRFRGLARDLAQIKSTQNDTSLNHFIGYLNEYAADLAGKSAAFDRALLGWLPKNGRTMMKALRWFNNRTKSNAVLGNISSVAKQVMNLPNGMALLNNPLDILPGIMDVFGGFKSGGKIQENYKKSNFLAERLGIDSAFSKFDRMGPGKIAQELLGIGDEFGTRAIWNAAYREGVKLEKHGDIDKAVKYADNLTRRAVAGRGIGEVPLAYKSELGRLALPFQIEVGNTWNVMRDVLSENRHDGKLKGLKNFGDKALRVALFYLATWGLSEALKALTGSKGSFDPLGDIIDGFKQGTEELQDKTRLEQAGLGGLRAAQNVAGDFIGNRSFGWAVSSFMDAIDNDWATKFFNDSIYPSQGVNIPAIQSLAKAGKKLGDKDWVGSTAELATSFITPWGGKQLDKTIRGLGDYARGGNYKNNIYKELSTGEHGDKYYDIEQTPTNLIKSSVFGPSGLGENDEYWKTKKLETYAKKEESEFKNKAERQFKQQIEDKNLSSEIIQFYKDEDISPRTASTKVKYKDKEYTLTKAERQQYQDTMDKEALELVTAMAKSSGFSKLSNDDKVKQISAAQSYAESVTKNEVLKKKDSASSITFFKQDVDNKRKYYSIWDDVEPNDVGKQAKGKAIGQVSSVVNALSKKSKLTPSVITGITKYIDEIEKRSPNAVDKELHRLGVLKEDYTDTENGDMSVTTGYMSMFTYTDDGQKYAINVRYSDMPQIMREIEKETYKQMERLINNQYRSQKKKTYGQRYNYKNADADQKIKWVNEVRTDVKNEFKSKYSRKYGVTKVVNKLKKVK